MTASKSLYRIKLTTTGCSGGKSLAPSATTVSEPSPSGVHPRIANQHAPQPDVLAVSLLPPFRPRKVSPS